MTDLAMTKRAAGMLDDATSTSGGASQAAPKSAVGETGLHSAALVSGFGLLAMTVLAPMCIFGVIGKLTVAGDPAATAANLVESASLFRLGAVGVLVVALLDVVVAWGLDALLRGVHQSLSRLGAWLRLVYAVMFAVAGTDLFGALRAAPVDARQTVFLLDSFQQGWQVALVVFGVHLGVVGVLVWRAPFISRIFGALLVVAGMGYVVDGLGTLLSPDYALGVGTFTFVGEVLFMFWLLVRGWKLPVAAHSVGAQSLDQ